MLYTHACRNKLLMHAEISYSLQWVRGGLLDRVRGGPLDRGRGGPLDCVWGVQTHRRPPVFSVPSRKDLARMNGLPQPYQKWLPALGTEPGSLDQEPHPLTIGQLNNLRVRSAIWWSSIWYPGAKMSQQPRCRGKKFRRCRQRLNFVFQVLILALLVS